MREYDDGDWYTKIVFDNAGPLTTTTVLWDIPERQRPGTYRIAYFGDSRAPNGILTPFVGLSTGFQVESRVER